MCFTHDEGMAGKKMWKKKSVRSLVLYQFDWPCGVVQAISTRKGGLSEPPFDELNLGCHVGDDLERVYENRRRLSAALNLKSDRWITVNQVHGDRILWVGTGEDIDPAPGKGLPIMEADGLATEQPGVPLVVFGADCGLLLFFDSKTRRIGAVHAGWRGTVNGLPQRMIEQFVERGSRAEDILVGIGPCIGPCCYPVGEEVAEAFKTKWSFSEEVLGPPNEEGKRALDIKAAQRLQLLQANVPDVNIQTMDLCTSCQSAELYSYRRDSGKTGRQGAIIMMTERAD
ncbi:peptidoglycan editing factor PgeF [Heliobacterium mobile]|nr:peptidoglycan editing factor PgeF [Heliobacterium mobile]